MEQKRCVVCNGTNISKNENVYICADCGTKYLKEEFELNDIDTEKSEAFFSNKKNKLSIKTIIISAVSVIVVSVIILFAMGTFNNGTEELIPVEETVSETNNIEYADEAFLEAMEKAVVERYERSIDDIEDKTIDLIDLELKYLEGFESKAYSNPQLAEFAKKYIEGEYQQREFYADSGMSKENLYYLGFINRAEVVLNLADNYDFLSGKPEIIAAFRESLLESLADQEKLADIQNQLNFVLEDGYYVTSYTNNTVYTYSIECILVIEEGVGAGRYTKDWGLVKPNETIEISYPRFTEYKNEFKLEAVTFY